MPSGHQRSPGTDSIGRPSPGGDLRRGTLRGLEGWLAENDPVTKRFWRNRFLADTKDSLAIEDQFVIGTEKEVDTDLPFAAGSPRPAPTNGLVARDSGA